MQALLGGVPAPVAAVGAAVAALGVTVFAVGEKFQSSFNKIKVATGESGPALDSLDASFKRVLAGTAGSFDQVAAAISGVHQRTGLVGPALDELAKKEVTLGRITKTDVGANVEATTALFNKFGISANDQSKALDVLFKASQNGGKGLDTLTAELQKGGVALKDLGFTLPQSAALISNLEKAGVNVGPVLSGLTKTLGTLAKAGKDPQVEFAAMIKQIQGAGSESEALGETIKVFGAKAGPELVAAIRSGKFEFADLAKQLADGKGGINETGTAVSTLGGKFARLKNEVLVAIEPAGAALVKFANEGMGKVLEFVPKLFAGLGALYNLLVKGDFTGAFARIFHVSEDSPIIPFLLRLREMVISVIGFIQEHARPILIGLGVVLLALTSPVSLVIGALVLLYTHFQSVRDAVGSVVAYVQEIFPKIEETVTHVVNAIRDVITVVLEVIRVEWAVWGDAIMAVVSAAWAQIQNVIQLAVNVIANVIKLVLDLINGDWGKAWDDIKAILSAAWDFIVNAVEIGLNLAWDLFKALPGKLLGALAGLGSDLFGVAERALASMVDAITGGIADAVSWVEGMPGRILGALGDLSGLLYNAGVAVIRGFLNGLKAAWHEVTDFVGGIGGWIADHKGPLEVDRVLLVPAGRAIMDGLRKGLVDRRAQLAQEVANITDLVASIGAGASNSTYAASGLGGTGGNTTSHTWQIASTDPHQVVAETMRALNWAAG
jgi:phage-related protein